jgi:PhzF family phenazine biosynthesis protein
VASRPFAQVDVFSETPLLGNALAVVLDGDGLTTDEMQRFATWMNLSETTFVVAPSNPAADYAVRIFDTSNELPFAGHPTLGTCHAWLAAGGRPSTADRIVQECGAGMIPIRQTDAGLAFRSPPPSRSGPVDEALIDRIAAMMDVERGSIVDAQWAVLGPNWVAVLLGSADAVLELRPGTVDLDLGVVGPYPPGAPAAFEVRAFFQKDGHTAEDPVTGSLNAAIAPWLVASGRTSFPYVVSQGRALGRRGRLHLSTDEDGAVWVAGHTTTLVSGAVDLSSTTPLGRLAAR